MTKKVRIETDLLGKLEVPADTYWGINTQRAIKNFQISDNNVNYYHNRVLYKKMIVDIFNIL